jgi:hypothetical protein
VKKTKKPAPKQKLGSVVVVRMSPQMLRAVRIESKWSGISQGEYVRVAVLKAIGGAV